MEPSRRKAELPPIPAKRYFTIGEVSELCGVKPHVLRYWEQEFTQLKPVKRRGNRRYYQHHEVLLIRRIRELLYEEGFTISGARNRLDTARLESVRIEPRAEPPAAEEKAEMPVVRELRPAPGPGVDVAALKRELRAVLDQLQR
jgi:DNA-binding transcriptional MerR regulator